MATNVDPKGKGLSWRWTERKKIGYIILGVLTRHSLSLLHTRAKCLARVSAQRFFPCVRANLMRNSSRKAARKMSDMILRSPPYEANFPPNCACIHAKTADLTTSWATALSSFLTCAAGLSQNAREEWLCEPLLHASITQPWQLGESYLLKCWFLPAVKFFT